jgi:Ca-activated chloride channel family protein
MVRVVVVVLCGLVGGAAALDARSQVPRFRGGVDLVALNVVVTDGRQKPVSGLTQENFIVFEDGVEQDVSFFATSHVPLDLALLLDTSASMSDKMQTVHEAATGFVSSLAAGDRISIVDIKDTVKVLHGLDGNLDGARAAIRTTAARGGTALYNGIYMTLKELARHRSDGEVRRQAIAVLSDGDDTASLVTFDDVMDAAKRSGVAIYTIALRSAVDIREAKASGGMGAGYSMKALALETGARSFFPEDIGQLAGVYGTIAEELASQYALGYTPKNAARDGAYRRVAVQVANVGGVRTRTRAGYVSADPPRIARH